MAPVGQTLTQAASSHCWHIIGTDMPSRSQVYACTRDAAMAELAFVLERAGQLAVAAAGALVGVDHQDLGHGLSSVDGCTE